MFRVSDSSLVSNLHRKLANEVDDVTKGQVDDKIGEKNLQVHGGNPVQVLLGKEYVSHKANKTEQDCDS